MNRSDCDHTNLILCGHNLVGKGFCRDCGEEVWVFESLNTLIRKLNRVLEELRAKCGT